MTTWQAPNKQDQGWVSIQQPLAPNDDRFRRTTSPTGEPAWRAETRRGDVAYNNTSTPPREIAGGLRAEGVGPSETAASGTVRYQWRTMFPQNFPVYNDDIVWQVFAQWHQGDPREAVGGSPPIAFTLDAGKMYAHLHQLAGGRSEEVGRYEIGDITPGQWHTFQVDITWSTDPAVGALSVRHDGAQVLFDGTPTYRGPTMYPGATSCPDPIIPAGADCTYFKMGLYREKTADTIEKKLKNLVVYHTDVQRLAAR